MSERLPADLFDKRFNGRFANRDDALAGFEALQAQAVACGVELRAPPPVPTTCCGRGCNGCVWEGFFDAAEYWCQEALLALSDALR